MHVTLNRCSEWIKPFKIRLLQVRILFRMPFITDTQIQKPHNSLGMRNMSRSIWVHTAVSKETRAQTIGNFWCISRHVDERCIEDKGSTPMVRIFIARENNESTLQHPGIGVNNTFHKMIPHITKILSKPFQCSSKSLFDSIVDLTWIRRKCSNL